MHATHAYKTERFGYKLTTKQTDIEVVAEVRYLPKKWRTDGVSQNREPPQVILVESRNKPSILGGPLLNTHLAVVAPLLLVMIPYKLLVIIS